ncbi:MAG: hypothetical protein JWL90_4055 [Chthoniobacteraceae bacterium]|nr:hypothetical protein [Chthoniobacteraceae bacterium]
MQLTKYGGDAASQLYELKGSGNRKRLSHSFLKWCCLGPTGFWTTQQSSAAAHIFIAWAL